ncbi:MAG: serine/threonine protein kinase/Tfp pilus assembly protein PilF [Planctomycetota bacterium]|jgi:serine/threonine protein kinase/Tfp pilus assembly protein PilF
MTDPNTERLALVFLERFWADQDVGKEVSLGDYLTLFPGNEETIANEYLGALAEARGGGGEECPEIDGEHIGPYRIEKELGRGGQGVVWLAEDTRLGRKVALKVLTGLGPGAESHLARFKREAALASKLEHPGICGVHDTGIEGGIPYIAMRYVEGETLGDRLSRLNSEATEADPSSFISFDDNDEEAKPASKPTSESSSSSIDRPELDRTIAAFEKIALAMHAAHDVGIVHRDIKPGNIMLTKDHEPILLDFGLAHDDSDDAGPSLTQTGDLFGTPAYMSPEQITGRRVVLDRRSDIYSLGVTLYECLTGKRPFEAPTREALYQAIMSKEAQPVRKLNRQISTDLEVVLQCTMDKDRDKRYQTAADLAEDLRRVRCGEPILAKKVSAIGRAWRWAKRRPAAAILISALVIGIPTITGLGVWYWDHRDEVAAQKQVALYEAVEDQLEIGFYELSLGKSAVAVTAFEEALSLDPSSAEATVGLTLTLLRQKTPEKALEVLDRSVVDPDILARTRARILKEMKGNELEAAAVLEAAPKVEGALMWFLEGLNAMTEGDQLTKGTPAQKAVFEKSEPYLLRAVQASTRARRAYHFGLARAAYLNQSPRGGAIADSIESLWPESSNAWMWAGVARWNQPNRAIESLRMAVRLNPDSPGAHHNLGTEFDTQKRWDEAVAAYREADRLNPEQYFILHCLGNTLKKKGKYDESVAVYREAIRLKPEYSRLHFSLGSNFYRQGKLDEAAAAYRDAIRLDPKDAEPSYWLGWTLKRQKKIDEAIIAWREAIRVQPDHALAHSALGLSLSEQNKFDESIAALQEAARLEPDNGVHFFNLGRPFSQQKKYVELIEACREAVRLEYKVVQMRLMIGTHLGFLGKHEDAMIELREIIRLKPDNAMAHATLGATLAIKGRHSEAVASLRRAIEIDPSLNKTKELPDTLERLLSNVAAHRENVKRNPEDPRKLNALAWMLVDPAGDASIRDPKEALPLARKAVEFTQRKNAAILDTLAVVLAANKNFKEAIAVREEILLLMNGKNMPGMTVAYVEAALTRYRLGLSKQGESKEVEKKK